jgi:hypothetical protein
MGIEFLENAARAAGFAMAAEEQSGEAEKVMAGTWRAGYASQGEEFHDKVVDKAQTSFSDWVKGVVGVNGRGAPA